MLTTTIRPLVMARLVLAGTLVAANSTGAQSARGEVSVSGGIATDQRGVRSNAITVSPSVLFAPDARVSLGLALAGTQFGSSVRALGGSATAGTRLSLGSVFALAASASGSMTKTSFNASYASLDLTPTVEATVAGVTLYAGGHLASGVTSTRDVTTGPGGLPGSPVDGPRDTRISRTSTGTVFGGVLNLAGARPDQGGAVSYREERAKVQAVVVTDRVAAGSISSGRLSLGASAGFRSASDERTSFGSVSATMRVAPSLALQGTAGTYPSNRVTGTLGGRYVSIGVTLHGVRVPAPARASAPHVRGAPPVPPGVTRLVVTARPAARVEVAGDWNQWTPTPAIRGESGTWYADVRLPRGEYRYAFRIDGQRWVVPEGVTVVDDGFGGRSAIIAVR